MSEKLFTLIACMHKFDADNLPDMKFDVIFETCLATINQDDKQAIRGSLCITIPLPPDRDSSHRLTVESAGTKHLAGVV